MATKAFYHDIDMQQVGELLNARVHNVTSAELTTLAGTLGAANRGLVVYNSTDSSLYTWNGSSFDQYAVEVTGDISFAGIINPTSSSSITPEAGKQYVVDTAGTLSDQGGAITYTPSANVEVGDVVLFTSATTASIMERNLEQATETTLGTIRLSSQAEVDAGAVSDEAVTPATLHGYVDPEFAADRARLTANEGDIAVAQADIITNSTDIATNAADIVTNAADIATNAADIVTEAGARAAADTTLQTNITAEETRALAAEATLTANVATNAADIVTEAGVRAAADTALQTNITAEETRALAAEAANTAAISAEETRALAAEAGLSADIATEAAARGAADSALDVRVSAVEARDEVFTYHASIDMTADVAFTVTHNLGLAAADRFVINTMQGGEQVSLQVTSIDGNSLSLTSSVGLTGVKVSVIGL